MRKKTQKSGHDYTKHTDIQSSSSRDQSASREPPSCCVVCCKFPHKKTAAYGHFGNAARTADPSFTWEMPKKLKV